MEVLGGFHPAAVDVTKGLARALARAGGQEENEVTRHLFGRLFTLLMRGNAHLILSRIPTHPEPQIDGVL